MKSIEAVGKNIEEAIEQGLKVLNLTRTDVDIKILSKGGWFSKARVLLTQTEEVESKKVKPESKAEVNQESKIEPKKEPKSEPKTEPKPVKNVEKTIKIEEKSEKTARKPKILCDLNVVEEDRNGSERFLEGVKKPKFEHIAQETPQEFIKIAEDFLQGLFQRIGIEAEITNTTEEGSSVIQISSPSASLIIGKHGETMQSIQSIMNSLVRSRIESGSSRILLDVENYRQRQVEKLQYQTKKAIERCLQNAKPISMDYMNAYERRIAHEIITEDGRVTSESYGKDPRRFVKIFIK